MVKVWVNVWTISWLLSSICCLHAAAELLVRLGRCVWCLKLDDWLVRPVLTPDHCTGELMLTNGSEKVEPALCKLAIAEVDIPYGCSRLPNGIEKLGGTKGLF